MSRVIRRVVIGIGSAHGQDAIGWRIVECLGRLGIDDVACEFARTPSEILDRCEGIDSLHLVDACIGPESGRLHQLQWPDERIVSLRWTSTHGIDVPGALQLATELGMLPASVTIWVMECEGNLIEGAWSSAWTQRIETAANRIARTKARAVRGEIFYRCDRTSGL
jgi:hydrogenase maturation protease